MSSRAAGFVETIERNGIVRENSQRIRRSWTRSDVMLNRSPQVRADAVVDFDVVGRGSLDVVNQNVGLVAPAIAMPLLSH